MNAVKRAVAFAAIFGLVPTRSIRPLAVRGSENCWLGDVAAERELGALAGSCPSKARHPESVHFAHHRASELTDGLCESDSPGLVCTQDFRSEWTIQGTHTVMTSARNHTDREPEYDATTTEEMSGTATPDDVKTAPKKRPNACSSSSRHHQLPHQDLNLQCSHRTHVVREEVKAQTHRRRCPAHQHTREGQECGQRLGSPERPRHLHREARNQSGRQNSRV